MVWLGWDAKRYTRIGSNHRLKSVFNWIPIHILINTLFCIVFIGVIGSALYIISFWWQSLSSISLTNLSFTGFSGQSSHESLEEWRANVLNNGHKSVRVMIDDNQVSPQATNSLCNHFKCFDVYRCGNYDNTITLTNEELINVYIYPSIDFIDSNRKSILSPISRQYRELLEAIITSPYYTDKPEKACLFVPNIDLLNQLTVNSHQISLLLSSLPHWGRGANHIIFSMIWGSLPASDSTTDLNIGDALIAGAGFDSWTYRPTFDVSIPVFSLFSYEFQNNKYNENAIQTKDRKWFVICTQFDSVSVGDQQILTALESQHSDQLIVLRSECNQSKHNNETQMCNHYRNIKLIYPKVLTESTFCLILRTVFLGHPVLSDALMSGCIPVIISDDYVLPFEEKIDWTRASVRIRSHSLSDLMAILTLIPDKKMDEMRVQTTFLWKTYFSSMKAIALTTLKIINERIFPNSAVPADHWNQANPSLTTDYAIISPKFSSRQSIGFTAVILTYDRLESLYEVIRSVVKAKSCVKVVVVWNNQLKSPPQLNKWPDIHIPLQIITTSENKLSNRFYPYECIETDAILAIDDDIVMLTPDELEFGYQVWREFPDRIVGFPSRVHRWDNRTAKWKYESEWTNDVSMVLTGAAFYHKYYNHLYTNVMPAQIKSWVDKHMNCEDIAMNFLVVSNVTAKSPIKVTPRKKFKCPECTNNDMLSADVIQHLNQRSDCINLFAAIYKSMPLKAVEFRADPVLYKDNLPEKLKAFNLIGSL
ncbi:unnamed protein product [Oppiella nova]|uniref:Exostosin-2 n=1 Tax=Oppiella nova TaxID=334625 RepID=A0A7R9LVC0_9ACAR|nr:unnamed protein product [Oppiella nova]CAG2167283.1 unnamed protein product [Oppiella nova]